MSKFVPSTEYEYAQYLDSLDGPVPIPHWTYPMERSSINRYLGYLEEKGDRNIAKIVDKIIYQTNRVSFARFLELLNKAADEFLDSIIDQSWIGIFTNLHKSELWVMKILHHIRPEVFYNMKFLTDLNGLGKLVSETDIKTFVLFDDGIFSGIHTIGILEEIADKIDAEDLNSNEFSVYLICALLGEGAIENISFDVKNRFKDVDFFAGELISSISSYLSEEEVDQLRDFYQLEEGDNDLADQYSAYFDHKMPGYFSGLPFVYVGQNPYGDPNIPLISGCEDMANYNCPPVPYRK